MTATGAIPTTVASCWWTTPVASTSTWCCTIGRTPPTRPWTMRGRTSPPAPPTRSACARSRPGRAGVWTRWRWGWTRRSTSRKRWGSSSTAPKPSLLDCQTGAPTLRRPCHNSSRRRGRCRGRSRLGRAGVWTRSSATLTRWTSPSAAACSSSGGSNRSASTSGSTSTATGSTCVNAN